MNKGTTQNVIHWTKQEVYKASEVIVAAEKCPRTRSAANKNAGGVHVKNRNRNSGGCWNTAPDVLVSRFPWCEGGWPRQDYTRARTHDTTQTTNKMDY